MRIHTSTAIELAADRQFTAYVQRGFYSKFLRVRDAEYRTVATIPIIRNSVSRRSLFKAFADGYKKGEDNGT